MRLMVTGASGLLGHKVAQLALAKSHEVYSLYREHKTLCGIPIKLDLTHSEKLLKVISELKPEAIIHTAAYTDVDDCEINQDLALKVNAEATKQVAIASANIGSHLTYVSTDYIFDGEKGLYTEDDSPNPINYYGYSKLRGEEYVRDHAEEWCVTRTSVIYGWGGNRQNFATWMINNLKQGKDVDVILDQHVSPTLNLNLAKMLLEIVERKIIGTIHTAGATRISRYEFAQKLAKVFNLNIHQIKPTSMNPLHWKAKRPIDSSLNVSKAKTLLHQKPLNLSHALEVLSAEAILD